MFRYGTLWALDYVLLPTCVEFFFVCDIYLFVLTCICYIITIHFSGVSLPVDDMGPILGL